MTEGNAILVVGLLIVAVAVFLAGFHFRRPLVWMASAAMWVVCGVVAYTQSVETFDSMGFLFWTSTGLAFVALLMTMQSRQMDDEETGYQKPEIDPFKEDTSDAEEYRKSQERIRKQTGGSVADRRRARRG